MASSPIFALDTVLKKNAGSDTNHDFGDIFYYKDADILSAYNDGMPSSIHSNDILNEDKVLINCLKGESNLDKFYNKIDTSSSSNLVYKFTVWDGSNDLYNYNGRMIDVKNPTNQNGSNICKALFSPSKPNVNLIVDFFQCHFLDLLKEGSLYTGHTVHYLFTPENENDPASKTPYNDKIFRKEAGVKTYSYFQSDKSPIIYTPFDRTKLDINNYKDFFYSTYFFQLSPLIQVKSVFGKSVKFKTDLTITNATGSSVNIVKNSKLENSIATLKKYILKLFNGRAKMPTRTNDYNFNMASKYQQKRSGDWLQALACLDVDNRTFQGMRDTNELKEFGRGTFSKKDTYFVTHDRIAAAYALIMGINVIFMTPTYKYYTFTSTIFEEITEEERFASINSRRIQLQEKTTEIKSTITIITRLMLERSHILGSIEGKITAILSSLEPQLKSPQSAVRQNVIRDLFKSVVEYSYVLETVPDLTDKLSVLGDLISNITDDTFLNSNIDNLEQAFYACSLVSKKYPSAPIITAKWMKQVESKDSWKAAARWVERMSIPNRMLDFLTRKDQAIESRKQDMNIFISSTLNLPSVLKARIVMEITRIYEKIKNGTHGFLLNEKTKPYLFLFEEIRLLYGESYDVAIVANSASMSATSLQAARAGIHQSVASTIQLNVSENTLKQEFIYQEQAVSLAEKERDPDNTNYLITSPDTGSLNIESSFVAGQEGGRLRKLSVQRGGAEPRCVIQDIDLLQTVYQHCSIHLLENKSTIMEQAYNFLYGVSNTASDANLLGGGPKIRVQSYNSGFHPMLPIQMILMACYQNIQPKLKDSPDYPFFLEYVNYVIQLCNMMYGLLLTTKYIDAIFFGFVLRSFFFTISNHPIIYQFENMIDNFKEYKFRLFTMMNTMMSHSLCGQITLEPHEDKMALNLLITNKYIQMLFNPDRISFAKRYTLDMSKSVKNINILENTLKEILINNAEIMNTPLPVMTRFQIIQGLRANQFTTPTTPSKKQGIKRFRNIKSNMNTFNYNSNSSNTSIASIETPSRRYTSLNFDGDVMEQNIVMPTIQQKRIRGGKTRRRVKHKSKATRKQIKRK
jgi:hypothetical protein